MIKNSYLKLRMLLPVLIAGCNANLEANRATKEGTQDTAEEQGAEDPNADKPAAPVPAPKPEDIKKPLPNIGKEFIPAKPTPGRVNALGKDVAVDLTMLDLPNDAKTVDIFLSERADCSDGQLVVSRAELGQTVTIEAAADGDFTVCYVVRDQDLQVIAQFSEEDKIIVDTTAPVLASVGSATPSSPSSSVNLSVEISDRSDVTTVWTTSGASPQQTLSNQSSTTVEFTSVEDGTFEVTATVTDAYGNAQAISFQVTVDTQGPTVADSTFVMSEVTSLGAKAKWTKATDVITSSTQIEYLPCISAVQADVATQATCIATAGSTTFAKDIDESTFSGLNPSTTYYFNIIAKDGAGHTAMYGHSSFTTAADTISPTIATFNAATAVNSHGFTLSWQAGSDDHTAASALKYFVCASTTAATVGTNAGCLGAEEMAFTTNKLTYTFTGKAPSTTYYVNVIVEDAAGNQSLYNYTSQTTAADTVAPTAGTTSATTGVSHNALTLNWSAATDAGTAAADLEYFICRAASDGAINTASKCISDGTEVMAFTANKTTFNVTGLAPDTTYFFRIVVRDAADNRTIYPSITQKTNTYPPNLAAPSSKISLSLNEAMSAYSFVNSGGTVTTCAVEPDLPDGLTITVQSGTCRLSGTPTAAVAVNTFELLASAADASTQTIEFDLEVLEVSREWETRIVGDARFAESANMHTLRTAVSSNGDAIVAWYQDDGIFFKRKSGGAWSVSKTRLATSTVNPSLQQVQIDSSGNIAILYRENDYNYVALFKDGSWIMPANASDYIASSGSGGGTFLAFSDSGHLVVGYPVSGGYPHIVERHVDGAWGTPVRVGYGSYNTIQDLAINPSGDVVLVVSSDSYTCVATRKSSVWTIPTTMAPCYSSGGTAKAAISDNGRMAVVYSSGTSGYFAEYNGTSWVAPASWSIDASISSANLQTLTFRAVMIDNNGDVAVTWWYGDYSYYQFSAFHSFRESSTWTHPTLASRTFTNRTSWTEYAVFSVMQPTKKGIVVGASYGGAMYGSFHAGAWEGDWSTLSVTGNLWIEGGDPFEISVASNRNGYGIAAWMQYPEASNRWLNVLEFK